MRLVLQCTCTCFAISTQMQVNDRHGILSMTMNYCMYVCTCTVVDSSPHLHMHRVLASVVNTKYKTF